MEKYRLYPVLMAEFEKAKAEMTAKEKFQFSLELARLGIVASPKTVDLPEPMGINLYINGVRQVNAIDRSGEIVQEPAGELAPAPRALPSPAVDWSDGLPGKRSEVCEALRDRNRKPQDPPPPPVEAPRGPIFTVPNSDEELGPPEWRTPMEDLLDD
ncbi:MAG: hypothetical protein Q7J17_05085 [Candidatus Deferrimicrobium sp.]|nr:hypothetical protein [Candidatus Deferrimicrobium sp.]